MSPAAASVGVSIMVEVNGWMSLPNAYANALFAAGGWDSVTLDAQHGLFDDRSLIETLHALSAASPKRLVRVPWSEPASIGRVLDAGADGVIAPMINSAADAKRLAEACWYPPLGARSFGPHLAALRAGGRPYEAVSSQIEVYAMIETREALEAVADIAGTPGITGLYVGPNDLALSLGLDVGSDREEPQMLDALRRVVTAAAEVGKKSGIFCASTAYARRMGAFGFSMVTAALDAGLLARSAANVCAETRL